MTWLYRYSEWDGTQEIPPLDPDEILSAITDDLMNFGDLQHALRNLLQRGLRGPMGQRMQGLRDLLQRLRQNRRQMLDRYNLSSLFEDLERRVQEVLDLEQETLRRRLEEAERQLQGQPGSLQPFQEALGQSGQQESQGDDARNMAQMLKNIAQRKQDYLRNLPQDLGGRIKGLQEYEFMDPEAAAKFQELMEMLRQAMLDAFFKDLYNQLAGLTPDQLQRLKEMVRDLNRLLSEKMAGGQPDYQSFLDKYGDLLGPNPPQSLDELVQRMQQQMAAMQSLLDSLPPEMRRQLQDLLMDKVGDPELMRELQELAINLDILAPLRDLENQYPFRGDETLDLLQAMRLMEHMQGLDELERQLERVQYGGSLDDIDEERLRELLGEEAYQTFRQLKELLEVLERAGYIRRRGQEWELTPKAIRRIGQKALGEIYAQIKKSSYGKHASRERGPGTERTEDTKRYEFGDPFHLHLGQTVLNAVLREGPQVPVRLGKDDFEVYSTEHLTTTATVMMLDLSWSMALRGSFQAAKRVALALYNLIKTQFPKDVLYILGFSAYARELKPEELPYVRWDESVLGTNMHHALILAQQLLSRHRAGTRQIIMISDGEPTAHLEHGRSYFSYPPSPITIRKTLQEVKRCTQKGIVINTFMLDRNYYLKEFVNQIAKMNKGRVFYTTPDKLGQYILVDYVAQKRKRVMG
ncbi:MAG TPA: VWA domain-containing protein [Dehalococcoidia bacterium]|nr:VWA domain-containing protein [Dehalococcoidia bacterium]